MITRRTNLLVFCSWQSACYQLQYSYKGKSQASHHRVKVVAWVTFKPPHGGLNVEFVTKTVPPSREGRRAASVAKITWGVLDFLFFEQSQNHSRFWLFCFFTKINNARCWGKEMLLCYRCSRAATCDSFIALGGDVPVSRGSAKDQNYFILWNFTNQ